MGATRATQVTAAAILVGGALVTATAVSGILGPPEAANVASHTSQTDISAPSPAPAPGTMRDVYAAAAAVALQLPLIDAGQHIPPYRRDDFGTPWADVDGNGCRQRDDILARDLTDVVIAADGCTVLSGVLHDPYTGTTIAFQHDRIADPGNPGSRGVQVDHIVSLAAAYHGGAWAWTDQQRVEFANTLDDVLAVDGTANQSKQDDGPASWLPQAGYLCSYVLQYTRIAANWHLAVDPEDRDALVRSLTDCAHAAPEPTS